MNQQYYFFKRDDRPCWVIDYVVRTYHSIYLWHAYTFGRYCVGKMKSFSIDQLFFYVMIYTPRCTWITDNAFEIIIYCLLSIMILYSIIQYDIIITDAGTNPWSDQCRELSRLTVLQLIGLLCFMDIFCKTYRYQALFIVADSNCVLHCKRK